MTTELFNEIQHHLADVKRTADLVSDTLNYVDKKLLIELPSNKGLNLKDKLDLAELLNQFCKQRGLKQIKLEPDFATEIFTDVSIQEEGYDN